MSGAATVRRARPEDIPACAGVVNGWIDATGWISRAYPPEEIARFVEEAFPFREIWVVGDPVAGYLSLDPETARIGGLYTDRPGHGLGKALLDRAKEGRDYLYLWTHAPNAAAHRFYEREGFARVERKENGDDGLPEIRMEWRR